MKVTTLYTSYSKKGVPEGARLAVLPKRRYSMEERIKIIRYFDFYRNLELVRKAWKADFNKTPPTVSGIAYVVRKFNETGSVADKPFGKGPLKEEVLKRRLEFLRQALIKNPTRSFKSIGKVLGIGGDRTYVHARKHGMRRRTYTDPLVRKLKKQIAEVEREIDIAEGRIQIKRRRRTKKSTLAEPSTCEPDPTSDQEPKPTTSKKPRKRKCADLLEKEQTEPNSDLQPTTSKQRRRKNAVQVEVDVNISEQQQTTSKKPRNRKCVDLLEQEQTEPNSDPQPSTSKRIRRQNAVPVEQDVITLEPERTTTKKPKTGTNIDRLEGLPTSNPPAPTSKSRRENVDSADEQAQVPEGTDSELTEAEAEPNASRRLLDDDLQEELLPLDVRLARQRVRKVGPNKLKIKLESRLKSEKSISKSVQLSFHHVDAATTEPVVPVVGASPPSGVVELSGVQFMTLADADGEEEVLEELVVEEMSPEEFELLKMQDGIKRLEPNWTGCIVSTLSDSDY